MGLYTVISTKWCEEKICNFVTDSIFSFVNQGLNESVTLEGSRLCGSFQALALLL